MDVKIEPSWKAQLMDEFNKEYFYHLTQFVKQECSQNKVYPPGNAIFRAFDCCKFDDVKVVIIGQDPYHGPGQADGLAFSVQEGVKMPPSLVNIFKEIQDEFNKELPPNGNLERWAKQGVLLLNATLTVRARQAGSHQNQGWEQFTDNVIRILSANKEGLVFLLWGAYAQRKDVLIDNNKHLVLKSPHPSPFSANRGFFGNGHFKKANEYLEKQGKTPVDW